MDAPLANCASQALYINRDGDKSLSYSEYICAGTITRVSVGNEISFGYTSNIGGNGWVYCSATPILTTQNNCQCGWNKATRIVGGSVAQPNEYVSMAGLVDSTATDGPIFCGAAIINENFALTAAHCFDIPRSINNLGVLVGDHDISQAVDTPYPALYQAQQIIKHESYVPSGATNPSNDIALVKTWDQIRWKRTIGPACLPFSFNVAGVETYFNNRYLVALGWGTTVFAGPSSNVLRKTSLQVISSTTCNTSYGDITSAKICTHSPNTDTCQKDSGGSLYWTASGRQYTIGIVSYGTGCGGTTPSVNTRVTSYLTWIQTKLGGAFVCQR